MSTLGINVRAMRKARGLTMEKLASLAQVTGSTIRDIETRGVQPNLETLRKLKRLFIVTYDELIGDVDVLSPEQIAEAIRVVGVRASKGDPGALAELQRLTDQLNARAASAPRQGELPLAQSAQAKGRKR